MSAASVDGFSGPRALVASVVDAWAIRGPGGSLGRVERGLGVSGR